MGVPICTTVAAIGRDGILGAGELVVGNWSRLEGADGRRQLSGLQRRQLLSQPQVVSRFAPVSVYRADFCGKSPKAP